MRDRQTCIGCGKQSPETETNYTLISAQFGWRLARYRSADGTIVVEWRCPQCWRDYKKSKGDAVPQSIDFGRMAPQERPPPTKRGDTPAPPARPSPPPPPKRRSQPPGRSSR
jgi:hypothetical protein